MNDPDRSHPSNFGVPAGEAPDETEQTANPYSAPAEAPAPLPSEPNPMMWVAGGAALGAIALGIFEVAGRLPMVSFVLPLGVGGVSIGLLIGGLFGRVVGRLLVARHRFRLMAVRRHELNEELLDRRQRPPKKSTPDDEKNVG